MTKLPIWAPRVGALLLGVGVLWIGKSCYDANVAERLHLQITADSLTRALQAETHRADSLGTAFTIQLGVLPQVVDRWHVVRDSALHIPTLTPDSVRHMTPNTAPVPMALVIATADTAITACLATVKTCEQLQAEKDSVIQTLGAQVANERKRRPGFFKRVGESVKWVAAGVILGAVVVR